MSSDLPEIEKPSNRATLRQRILLFVSGLIVLSVLGSTISLFRITEVNRLLDSINRVSVPLGRLFAQIQSDADVLKRELDRGLGQSHWSDPHWRPRPTPRWIEDVLDNEVQRLTELIRSNTNWTTPEARRSWEDWAAGVSQGLEELRSGAAKLYTAIDQKDQLAATEIYPRWMASVEEWRSKVQWGAKEYERGLRDTFSLAQSRVSELRTGLEVILIVVVSMSLLLMWLGERALRPLSELTRLAREITRRGLRKEDKLSFPEIPLARTDEVSQLGREFHRMATALLEREKTVDAQKRRLQEQNKLLMDIGELNENILNSIESVLIVADLSGTITQCNPEAARWLSAQSDAGPKQVIGSALWSWPKLAGFLESSQGSMAEARKIDPCTIEGRIYGGRVMPLRNESSQANGAILVIDDLTEELDLQERLRHAENLAAVGRLSAQVAHEVRNPLHSIGLEAEMALELASKSGNAALRLSVQSILSSVDRLEKITENYLKLSRLSAGEKGRANLAEILNTVLATYASVCEAQGVSVDWQREPNSKLDIFVDSDLLEQALGNLLRNSLQALEAVPREKRAISWSMGSAETGKIWIQIRDSGPGIIPEVREKLFTPFLTTRAQGTGLGLSFVKKIFEDHGGTIDCIETGHGACFVMTLPPAPSQPIGLDSGAESQRRPENAV